MRLRSEQKFQGIPNKLPRLLIIDDSEQVVEFISELFVKEYVCFKASDGQEGVLKAEQLYPDIILCDVRMPKKSGLDVVRELKSNPKTKLTPIILLSGYNTRENRLSGLRAMADDFLAKPFDYEELRIKMSNLLQVRKDIQKVDTQDILHKELGLDTRYFNPEEHYFIEHIAEFLIANYSNRDVNVEDIADHMGISVRQLQRKTKAISTFSPMDLLRIFRLRQASQLLGRHKCIAEVSEACGFKSPNYFCTCFRDYFQTTPSKFQKKAKSEQ